jgi:hypothetical protein
VPRPIMRLRMPPLREKSMLPLMFTSSGISVPSHVSPLDHGQPVLSFSMGHALLF